MHHYTEITFCFTAKTRSCNIVHYQQHSDHREASFELSSATICPQGSKLWCSEDLAVDNALRGGKLGKHWGSSGRILTPNKLDLTFWGPNYHANFHRNRVGIATTGEVTDRQTHRKSDFIICSTLCNSNGTDKNRMNVITVTAILCQQLSTLLHIAKTGITEEELKIIKQKLIITRNLEKG